MLNWLLLNTDLLPEDLAAIPANTGSVKLDAGATVRAAQTLQPRIKYVYIASVDDPQAVH
jgi:hypothetical protein